jgi:uncharacterized membrane protein YeaQ/YmgE (transglycosylase-associated protein family)
MGLIDILLLLAVAGVCGAIGQALTGFSGGGCLLSVALGFLGALVGLWIARALELPELLVIEIDEARFPIVWSIIGSALVVGMVSLLAGPRRRSPPA